MPQNSYYTAYASPAERVVQEYAQARHVLCRFLSAADTARPAPGVTTRSLSLSAEAVSLFLEPVSLDAVATEPKYLNITWYGTDTEPLTTSCYLTCLYESQRKKSGRRSYALTGLPPAFELLQYEYTGALWLLLQMGDKNSGQHRCGRKDWRYHAFVFNTEAEIEEVSAWLCLPPVCQNVLLK